MRHFSNLFTTRGSDSEPILGNVEKKVTDEHNRYLLRPFDAQEVKDAISSMHTNKSPGSDGMNPAFLQAYWENRGPRDHFIVH